MALKSKAELKAYFETGDFPTQSQFSDFIDSILNLIDNKSYGWEKFSIDYTAFQPNTTNMLFVDAMTLPAGFQPTRFIFRPKQSWTGGTISQAIFQLFHPGDSLLLSFGLNHAENPITNIIGTNTDIINNYDKDLINVVSGASIRLKLYLNGATSGMNDLTSGELDIYYQLMKM